MQRSDQRRAGDSMTRVAARCPFVARRVMLIARRVGLPAIDRSSTVCDVYLRERHLQPVRKLVDVVVSPEVQEEQAWLVVQHVVVDCGDLDPAVAQRLLYRVDLFRDQYEIARNGRLAGA